MPSDAISQWMLDLAKLLIFDDLPTGVIGSPTVIEKVTLPPPESEDCYQWHLVGVEQCTRPHKPRKHPQPAWFEPFQLSTGRCVAPDPF